MGEIRNVAREMIQLINAQIKSKGKKMLATAVEGRGSHNFD